MIRILTFILLYFSLNLNYQIKEIYKGKKFSWLVFYDDNKKDIIIEIYGIKYGCHDRLLKSNDVTTTIASSSKGKLYRKKGNLYYSNQELKIDIRLDKKKYSSKIDYKRKQLFEINAFNEVSHLKDSLQLKDYQFDWNVKEDYEYFRNTTSFPEGYMPEYKKKVLLTK